MSDSPRQSLLTIGQLAKCSRLTVKALRHYAEVGLLEPDWVDPSSGYRYYSRQRARDAVAIAMLRGMDLPLAAIRELLAAPPERFAELLREQQRRIAAEVERQRAAIASLDWMIGAGDLLPHVVSVCEQPERELWTMSATASHEQQEAVTTQMIRTLFAALAGASSDPCACEIEPGPDEGLLCLTVGVQAPSVGSPPPGASLRSWPGGVCATTRHRGPYSQLGLAHHALYAWIHQRGHRERGPVREHYLNDPKDTPPGELLTELFVPIDASR